MKAFRLNRVKYGKIAIVLFLTALIWVWADLELDEEQLIRGAVIEISQSTAPELWVSFGQRESVKIDEIVLSGPHSAFVALDKKARSGGGKLRFVFDAASQRMTEPGGHTLRLLDFLQKDKGLRTLGLKVKSCQPEVVDVNVVALSERSVLVECFDEDGLPLKAQSIRPSKVEMYVPASVRTAQVQLNAREIELARTSPLVKTPFVVFAEGVIRKADTPVQIRMPEAVDALREETITAPKLGIAMSVNLQGKYSVEIMNLSEVISPIKIKATAAARQAYEGMRYQVILEIDDEDAKAGESRRAVRYNFPDEFVRSDEIKIDQAPVQARFKLTPIPTPGERF